MSRRELPILPQSFFARQAAEVAHDLIGMELRHGEVALRITEVEAYGDQTDSASHARHGRTARNAPMWGPPGRLYVYLCYGIHQMLNVVTGGEGEAGAVLIRAGQPLRGLTTIRARRGGRTGPDLLTGPGKVGAALAIDRTWNDHPVWVPGGIEIGPPDAVAANGRGEAMPNRAARIVRAPRIGISFATPADQAAPLRFYLADQTPPPHSAPKSGTGKARMR